MDINSTMIKSVEYDKANKSFKVQFHTGKTYEYKNVSPAKFNKFMAAESKGKFLNTKIKPKHEFSQMEKEAFWAGFLDEVKQAEVVTPRTAKHAIGNAAIKYLFDLEESDKKEARLMVHGLSHMLAMHPRSSSKTAEVKDNRYLGAAVGAGLSGAATLPLAAALAKEYGTKAGLQALSMAIPAIAIGSGLGYYAGKVTGRKKTATIVEEEGDFVLYTKDGSKILGRHPTMEKALAQERAIEISKAK